MPNIANQYNTHTDRHAQVDMPDQMNNRMQLVDVLGHRRDVLERDHCSDGPNIQTKGYASGLVQRGLAPTRQPHHCT